MTTGGINADATATIAPNVDLPVEGILRYSSNLTISGAVIATAGLTVNSDNGGQTLNLSSSNNHIQGPITVLGGALRVASLGDGGSTDPITFGSGRYGVELGAVHGWGDRDGAADCV